jgi:excisionase family DNA binding protein
VSEVLLVPVRVAARCLGIGRDSCYRLIRERRLRAIAVGRRLLVPRVELERWIEREMGSDEGVIAGS